METDADRLALLSHSRQFNSILTAPDDIKPGAGDA